VESAEKRVARRLTYIAIQEANIVKNGGTVPGATPAKAKAPAKARTPRKQTAA
jgi:hypothetical protein